MDANAKLRTDLGADIRRLARRKGMRVEVHADEGKLLVSIVGVIEDGASARRLERDSVLEAVRRLRRASVSDVVVETRLPRRVAGRALDRLAIAGRVELADGMYECAGTF